MLTRSIARLLHRIAAMTCRLFKLVHEECTRNCFPIRTRLFIRKEWKNDTENNETSLNWSEIWRASSSSIIKCLLRRKQLENTFLFLQLAYRRHLSVTKTELFENAARTGGIWKHRLCVFSVDGKHFENGAFWKTMTSRQSRDFLVRVLLECKSKRSGDCCMRASGRGLSWKD